MNRNDAKKIADVITSEQLHSMFANAKSGIKDWTKPSIVNMGLSKGVAWNILSKVDLNDRCKLGIINAICEFGEWLPKELISIKKGKGKAIIKTAHQEPNFDLF
jgi:hypothetical protein